MRLRTFKISVCCFAFSVALCSAEVRPIAMVQRTSPFNVDFSHQPLPIFRGGVVLARQQSPPGFSVFDLSGKLFYHQDIVLPGASSVSVIDAAGTQNGETVAILVSGADADQHFSSAILLTGVNAPETKVVRLDAFAPRRIIFAADDVLWAFGTGHDNNLREATSYDTVRRYDRSGKFLGSSVPRSTFRPTKIAPSTESFLAKAAERIGILSLITSEWVELSPAGDVIGRWPVQIPEGADITGIAMTDSNEMYVTQQLVSAETKTATDAITLRQLNKATGQLIPVDTHAVTTSTNQGMHLLGSQGNELVVRVKPASLISWLRVK